MVGGRVKCYTSGAYYVYLGLAINSEYVTQILQHSVLADDTTTLPSVPIKIKTDGTTVSLRGKTNSATTTDNYHEIFAVRIAGA